MITSSNYILQQRYFALYWGQQVGKRYDKPSHFKYYVLPDGMKQIQYLSLKPYMEDLDIDQQRALGHATPYMNYSINDLMKAGWLHIEG